MPINPYAIFSKTGKGVQEASGKTGLLARSERAVLQQIDGKTTFADLQQKFEKTPPAKFEALIQQLDNDGFIREVQTNAPRPAPPPPRAKPAAPPASAGEGEELDFTSLPPSASRTPSPPPRPTLDLAAQARAEAERRAKEQAEIDFRAREEAVARARAEAEARTRAELEAKVKAAREAAVKAAAEAKVRAEAEAKALAEAAEKERQAAAVREREALEQARRAASEKERIEAELNRRLEAERQAREAAERAAREYAERERAAQEQARKEAEDKARREAEELRRQLAEERARAEAERRAREESERRAKEEAEQRARREAEDKARREAEEQARKEEEDKARREAEERARREAEEKARREAEEKARKEEEDKARREAEERTRREAEDKARREAEEKARKEEEDKARREAEERTRREAEEKARREAEEKARREAEEKARKEEEDKARREAEEQARRDAEDRARREAEERTRREAEEKARREAEEKAQRAERAAQDDDAEAARRRAAARALVSKASGAPPKAPAAPSLEDSLLADLDSFAKRDDETAQAKEAEARAAKERAAKEAAARAAKDAEERAAREAAERAARDAAERAEREAAARAAAQAAERRAKETARAAPPAEPARPRSIEEARREAEEERRRAREEQARRAMSAADREAEAETERQRETQADERRRRAVEAVGGTVLEQVIDDEFEIDDRELDFTEIEQERALIAKAGGKRERKPMPEEPPVEAEKEVAPVAKKPSKRHVETVAAKSGVDEFAGMDAGEGRAPVPWAKYGSIGAIVLLVGGVAALHLVPVATAPYEKAASDALGMPVRIGAAHRSLFTGIQMKFERVSVGEAAQIGLLRAHGGVGILTGEQSFERLELEQASIGEEHLGAALFGALSGSSLKVARVTAKGLKLTGPLTLPTVDVELTIGGNGAAQSVTIAGPDRLQVKMLPNSGALQLEAGAENFAVPFVPGFSLAEFGAKGRVTREGLKITEFDGRVFEGVVSGSAQVRWGATWSVEGELRVRNLNAAVFAPALLSEGRAEGRGLYSMSGAEPAKLAQSARLEGSLKIDKGALGSFDLARAIQTNGAQSSGRTLFGELAAQGVYQAGATQLRNITISAGPMNAGASLDVSADGALAGRVVADLKTPAQTFRATLAIGGTTQDPVLRR